MKVSPVFYKLFMDNHFGKSYPLTANDLEVVRRKMLSNLRELKPTRFKNMIGASPYCESPFGNREFFLINTDPYYAYEVTLEMHWRSGTDEGVEYITKHIEAGRKISLGCEQTSTFPPTIYGWKVVGETRK
jgi:hypothetical protein